MISLLRPAVPFCYCDYIAHRISTDLSKPDRGGIITTTTPIRADLHPEGGYLVSTKKTLTVADRNGRHYRVTVEEVTV
jgi:hypothetical protein